MLPVWWEPEEAPSQPGAAGEVPGAGAEGAAGTATLLNCCGGQEASTQREPVAVESEGAFAHRMVAMRKALADRPERVLGVVAYSEVVAALTGLELGPGEAGSRRMQLFCSRCRCGACWAPAGE
ncbi:hypothetical protein HYH03_011831 [Edaphochlamys debaryana]|uniref:Uncharacterized protein n=1 Tax=Edaphochlamys debaryana TaxID=47281 RepID=A0A835Y265_9CHLO|nr:hypothetical protein HYH03_011831 [Edaphochlamys debaryana]|eukprot:KAG2489724.1 hypothetical protein HYH03_011831 [Edaphochlamys debaryana]